MIRIALAGNPNSGKTTLYNALTGKTEHVGNWSGVTVEKKEARLKKEYAISGGDLAIVDLPGAYSISPFTNEEAITRDFIEKENPDVIINVVDGANVSRSLLLTTQLLDLGIPVVIALNKSDIISRRKDSIDTYILGEELGCKVVSITATTEDGLDNLIQTAVAAATPLGKQVTSKSAHQDHDNGSLARQERVNEIVQKCMIKRGNTSSTILSDRLDRIIAHKWLGLPIFFLVMWFVYAISIEGIGGSLSAYFNDIVFGEALPNAANRLFEGMGVHPMLQALIVDGALAGVGAVIGFLPLIMVLFFCLALLEDSGYMARVALIMDQYFKKFGLSGKSIIPMIVGSGCSIPGVMATRTIADVNERRMTTILTPFVPCGAKLPIIALFSAAFFPESSWVGPSVYIVAIGMIIIGGLLLKKVFLWENTSSFIIELPEYKVPNLRNAFSQMIKQAKGFLYKASTIILVMNTLVWFMQAYSWSLQPVEEQGASILAHFGGVLAPLLIPLGFAGWQLAAATVTGFIAKENVVATFAILLGLASEEALHLPGGALASLFTPVTAYAFLIFNLFTPPCFAAIGAMNAELGSKKWLFRALAFQFGIGYVLAMLVSQIGTLLLYGTTAKGFGASVVISALLIFSIIFRINRTDKKRQELSVANA